MLKKRILSLVLAFSLLAGIGCPSVLAAPYDSYNYSYWDYAVPAPASYLPSAVISAEDAGTTAFNSPQDMFVTSDHRIYVADTANARIVILDSDYRLIRIITEFERDGGKDQFKTPTGVFVKEDGTIYVADTDGNRVVVMTNEGKFIRQMDHPKSDVLPADFAFFPLKVAVDRADRVYVVAKGVFEGIMQFNSDGSFIGYMGTNTVTPNLTDYFWKMISTQAQRVQMTLFVPTEFSNMDLDATGFVFASNIDRQSNSPIKRLNPSGNDVLKRYGYFPVRGDVRFPFTGERSGPSQMMDVKAGVNGTYSALDVLRGRIFTYDEDGNLLYIFGQTGSVTGTLKIPTALERIGEQYLVLDAGTGRITVFAPTVFGRNINEAIAFHFNGKEKEAAESWRKVLALNANYDIAYIGIGKAQLRDHDYKAAMKNFKLGMNRKYYSAAYKLYRKQWLKEHMGNMMTGVVVLAALLVALRVFRKSRNRRSISSEA